jgi:hypothetical protein
MNVSSKLFSVALMAAVAPWLVAPVAAGPVPASLGLRNAVAPSVETVQYRHAWRGGYRGYHHGGGPVGAGIGLGLGLAAGVGGAIIGATQPYGYYGYAPGYGYAPSYAYGPSYGYAPGYDQGYAGGNEVAYCQQRFRSYDPGSGTYVGFDGARHPCP